MEHTETSFFSRKSTQTTMKLLLIGLLTVLLFIPQAIMENLIFEREQLSNNVAKEIAIGWGGDQIVTSPILVIPYYQEDTSKIKRKSELIIMPNNFKVNGDIKTTPKHKSIYEVMLYESTLKMNGVFNMDKIIMSHIPSNMLLMDEAYVVIGISDLKGIQNNVMLNWNNTAQALKGGTKDIHFKYTTEDNQPQIALATSSSDSYVPTVEMGQSFHAGLFSYVKVDLSAKEINFDLNIDLKGSRNISFAPLASNTEVSLKSSFADPSFNGKFLPNNKVDEKGFEATWKVLEYNRNLPDFTTNTSLVDIGDNLFGVKLQKSVSNYTKTNRAIKYMLLIIVLTFLVFFLTETMEKKKIHIFQYTLTGLALAIFYTLLLAFSEIISFDISYLIAAIAIIILLFLYSKSLFKSAKSSKILLAMTSMVFAYIYSIIQLEKTALLFGAIGLFIIIAATMYATRKINWYENEASTNEVVND